MSQSPGTGLRDVFHILLEAPPERLHSLTLQLGGSPEERVVYALCQVVLGRPDHALETLRALEDHSLACHLAERWQAGPFDPDGFAEHCGRFQALTGETLEALAQIFRVLTQQRLCDQPQRDLAYKRAVSSDCQKTDELRYREFVDQAKDVCGPQVLEWMSSSTAPGSLSSSRTPSDGTNRTLELCESPAPSSLKTSSSMPSFPTHLEMSIPSTIPCRGHTLASHTSGNHNLSLPSLSRGPGEDQPAPERSAPCEPEPRSQESAQCSAKKDSNVDETSAAVSCSSNPAPQKTDTQPRRAQPAVPDAPPAKTFTTRDTQEAAEEEDDDTFYAFVILHAPEDVDVAESMKEKVEGVVGEDGATFSGDFAIPGRSTLKCVEDAINNSAFTLLLLTRSFNTRMLDVKTNTALMNAINNEHKYNTVIPLLPRENCMPRPSIPLVLQTIVPLEENRAFERKIQKFLSPAKINVHRRKWSEEQRRKRQERLRVSQNTQTDPGRAAEPAPPVPERWPLPQSICIQNAKYIMIGNDSQMTVSLGDGADGQDAV
uniref:TIR domain-containing adapter molecule 1-like n=2 Tax=Salarias fasciatus TaxID=181472 RepID=A0A672FB30_SALFA